MLTLSWTFLGLFAIHIVALENTAREQIISGETEQIHADCPVGGVVAICHGRRVMRLHDTPAHGRPVRLDWVKRIWRCADTDCPAGTFTETHALAPVKAKLTTRAVHWATDALSCFDTSLSAMAYQLGVSWHTLWRPVKAEAQRRTSTADRLARVDALGVDEHVWVRTGCPGSGMVTGIIDNTDDASWTLLC